VNRSLVIKLTAGADEAEKCAQAFTVAATALSAGVSVSMWLTGDAVWFAVPGKAEAFALPHAAQMADLRDAIIAAGTLTVCTQCATRRDIEKEDLIEGTRIAGAAAFVEEALADAAQALVY
jgi:predicted peroxiredoxin